MKALRKINLGFVFAALMGVALFSACEESNNWEVDSAFSRLFRPSNLAVTAVTATTANVSWSTIPGTGKYVLELSKDSLLFENIVATIETDAVTYALAQLEGTTAYSIRIKAVPTSGSVDDSKYSSIYFKTKSEQIMSTVQAGDKTHNSVVLHWTAGLSVTHIVITDAQGIEVVRVDVTSAAKEKGEIAIDGLLPQTSYTASIYNVDNKRGYTSFLTFPEVPAADLIVRLAEGDSINQALFDSFTVSSITITVPAGAVFSNSNAITLPNGLSVHFFGLPGDQKAKFSINQIKLGTSHGSIKFTNLDISGLEYVGGVATGIKFNYLINQSTATMVESFEFDNCLVHDFTNTPFRLQAADVKTIGLLKYNNCIVYNLADSYYFINTNVATGVINNIDITNSTFYNVSRLIMHSLANNNRILISDCTFNGVIAAGRYLVDMSTYGPSEFRIVNTILGRTISATAKGIRSKTAAVVTNSYSTSDWVLGSNVISGVDIYSGASTDLFTDPAAGNFTIKDELFGGKNSAGDPRWRIE